MILAFVGVLRSADVQDAMTLNQLGLGEYSAGNYRAAEPLLERAIALWSNSAANSPDLGKAVHNLAAVYRAEGRYAEAARLYQRALNLHELLAGAGSPELIPLLTELALVRLERGDAALAQRTAQRALDIVKSHHLERTLAGASAFAAMGTVLQAVAQPREAQQMLRDALEIRERWLEPTDPLIAYALNSLALSYREEGRLAAAAKLFSQAIDIYQTGPASKDMPAVLNNLGRLRADQGDRKEAERLFRRAIRAAEAGSGGDHPETAVGLNNLANLLVSRHKFEEAAHLLERAAAINRRYFPPDNVRIAYDLNNAAHLALERKRYVQAEQLLAQSVAILAQKLSPNHPDVGTVIANLAEAYRRQGRLEESEAEYRKALQVLERAWGRNSPLLRPTLQAYSLVLRAQREYAEAEQLEVRSTRIQVVQALRAP